jgi:uncharacterized protein CbrC (UPF0167 family)
MRRLLLILIPLALLAVPGAASAAYSGSITDLRPNTDGSVNATYTSTFSECDSDGYCGWYPHAWEVPASSTCNTTDTNFLTYVGGPTGGIVDDPGTVTESDRFTPHYTPTRICLYASHAGDEYFLADAVYPAAAVTPTPTPTPTPAPPPLSIAKARSLIPYTLNHEYHSRFARSTLKRACARLNAEKVRCRVAWRKQPYKYTGTVTFWNARPGERYAGTPVYTTSIRRERH